MSPLLAVQYRVVRPEMVHRQTQKQTQQFVFMYLCIHIHIFVYDNNNKLIKRGFQMTVWGAWEVLEEGNLAGLQIGNGGIGAILIQFKINFKEKILLHNLE